MSPGASIAHALSMGDLKAIIRDLRSFSRTIEDLGESLVPASTYYNAELLGHLQDFYEQGSRYSGVIGKRLLDTMKQDCEAALAELELLRIEVTSRYHGGRMLEGAVEEVFNEAARIVHSAHKAVSDVTTDSIAETFSVKLDLE